MKTTYIKYIIVYGIVSYTGCFAEEKTSTASTAHTASTTTGTVPPPPVQSSLTTSNPPKAVVTNSSSAPSSHSPTSTTSPSSTSSTKNSSVSTPVSSSTAATSTHVEIDSHSASTTPSTPVVSSFGTISSSTPAATSTSTAKPSSTGTTSTPATSSTIPTTDTSDSTTPSKAPAPVPSVHSDVSTDKTPKTSTISSSSSSVESTDHASAVKLSTPPVATTSTSDISTPSYSDPSSSTTSDSTKPVDDKDASTGIQGAHITSGIDFEGGEKEDVFSIGGVDTSHTKYSSGNWVEKKKYWNEIEEIVDQVKQKIADITDHRTTFFASRSEVDKELSTFYQHVGLDQGPLQDMIHYTLEIMEKEKEHQGFLNKKERTFYEKVQAKQRVFEQLKEDVKAIGVVDSKIDEALEVVLKQINSCNEYEGEVWNIYKTVAYELSEKEAEHYYLVAKAFLKDIENIQLYLAGPFQTYFNELTESLQTHTHNIVIQLDSLEKEGINLKKEAAIFESEEEAQGAANGDNKHTAANTEGKKEVSSTKKEEPHKKSDAHKSSQFSIVRSVKNFFTHIVTVVENVFQSIKGLWSPSKKQDQLVAKKPTVDDAKNPEPHNEPQKEQESSSSLPEHENSKSVSSTSPASLEHHTIDKKEEAHSLEHHTLDKLESEEHGWEKTFEYDKEKFGQEMEELKQSLEVGAHEAMEAPVELEEIIKKEM